MTQLTISRIRAVLVTGGVGALVAHTAFPFAPGASLLRRGAFLLLMLALGALFGWGDARLREVRGRGAVVVQSLGWGVLALVVALVTWWGLH